LAQVRIPSYAIPEAWTEEALDIMTGGTRSSALIDIETSKVIAGTGGGKIKKKK
jgi:hypothetical protein